MSNLIILAARVKHIISYIRILFKFSSAEEEISSADSKESLCERILAWLTIPGISIHYHQTTDNVPFDADRMCCDNPFALSLLFAKLHQAITMQMVPVDSARVRCSMHILLLAIDESEISMKILLTGATGYIAKRLLPVLLKDGHQVVCCVRDVTRFSMDTAPSPLLEVIRADFLDPESLTSIPADIDAAYYLIHSMSRSTAGFEELEARSARHFVARMASTAVKQVIYLSGIVNETKLSRHLSSRKQVEEILAAGAFALTTLRAGIIIGSGSASFEIIRDLVEKLPVMVAPRWLHTRTQPIASRNVIEFLHGVLMREELYGHSYDIGGPDILTYKEMLLRFARVRGLKRWIGVVPVMTPKLSSYWLYFITSTSYSLAVNLVNSMKVEVICRPNDLAARSGIVPIPYDQAIALAFDKIEQNQVVSSWKDALNSDVLEKGLSQYIQVPSYGCYKDDRALVVESVEKSLARIWTIGGDTGWYYGDWLWHLRGFIDKLQGGVGLRRGRTSRTELHAGDALDFWRVILASREEKRLLLYAEMKLPGEAWLEFRIDGQKILHQTATFRPWGLKGRLYWYSVLPFHLFVFRGMLRRIAQG